MLPPDATLDELGVLDGELLRLGPAGAAPGAAGLRRPRRRAGALAAPTAEPDRRWCAVIVLISAVPAALLLGGMRAGGRAPLGRRGARRAGRVGRGDRGGGAAAPGRRSADSAPGQPAALVPALCAVPLAAAAAWAAAPGRQVPVPLLLAAVAAGTAAAAAQVAVRTAAPR